LVTRTRLPEGGDITPPFLLALFGGLYLAQNAYLYEVSFWALGFSGASSYRDGKVTITHWAGKITAVGIRLGLFNGLRGIFDRSNSKIECQKRFRRRRLFQLKSNSMKV
jgi:hypothetical protein